MLVRFATMLVTARLLTPKEFGAAAIGFTVMAIAAIIRDFGGAAYLVQVDKATQERVQTVFTVLLILTLPLAIACALLARPIAEFYGAEGLETFMWITSACFLLGPFGATIQALLCRELAFGRIAFVSMVSTTVNSATTVVLALLGFSYLSFAWAELATAIVSTLLFLYWHPAFAIYRISFHDWRKVTEYGIFDSTRTLLYNLWASLPLLVIGRVLGTEALGLFQRALTLSQLPINSLLSGLAPVLLPAMAREVREGRSLKDSFLKGILYTSVVLWPAMLLIVLLAKPIVLVLLGSQWTATIPLVQIMGTAFLFWFTANLTNPTLIAAGRIRDTFMLALISVPVMIAVQVAATFFGVEAVAASLLLTVPFFIVVSLIMVRRHVPFDWSELTDVLGRSGLVAAMSAIGPVAVVLFSGGFYEVSIVGGAIGIGGAGIGWLVGLKVANHPMLGELERLKAVVLKRLPAAVAGHFRGA